MRVFTNQTCTMVAPILEVLHHLEIPYEQFDIDQDAEARAYLPSIANGNLSVPTIEFEDGTVLVEPTPAQIYQHFAPTEPVQAEANKLAALEASIRAKNEEMAAFNQLIQMDHQRWLWSKVLPAFWAGLLVFALGISLGGVVQTSPQTSLYIFGGLLASAILALFPPVQRHIQKLQARMHKIRDKWLFTYAFVCVMGIFFASTSNVVWHSVSLWLVIVGIGTPLLTTLFYVSRGLWNGVQKFLLRVQRPLAVVMVVSMIVIMVTALTTQNAAMIGMASFPLLISLTITFFTSVLQVATGGPSPKTADNVSAILGACVGLLMVGYFVLIV